MRSPSFLFIPDITGFTDFVNQTAIQHGQHIISELLELIINADKLDLEVAEVEGDAVMFYKEGEVPSAAAVLEQVRDTFIKFRYHLREYETYRICRCGACSTAVDLSLKFIVHAGELGFTEVKGVRKPYGSPVVEVHKFLKNNVTADEYVFFSATYLNLSGIDGAFDLTQNSEIVLEHGMAEYDKIGRVDYQVGDLSHLIREVPDPPPRKDPARVAKPLREKIIIERPLNEVFEVVTSLDLRLTWNKSVKEIIYDKGKVNRVGTRHRCQFQNGFADFETVTGDFGEDAVVYGERVEKVPFARETSLFFIMRENGARTELTLEFHYVPSPILGYVLGPFIRSKFKGNMKPTLEAIKASSFEYGF